MIDFILCTFVLLIFLAGVWVGGTYGSIRTVTRRGMDWLRSKI